MKDKEGELRIRKEKDAEGRKKGDGMRRKEKEEEGKVKFTVVNRTSLSLN